MLLLGQNNLKNCFQHLALCILTLERLLFLNTPQGVTAQFLKIQEKLLKGDPKIDMSWVEKVLERT